MATQGLGSDARVPDLTQIPWDDGTRRALETALAGGHHLLLVGPAGSGKTGLVRSLPGLLPPLWEEEAREVGAIYRRAGEPRLKRSLPPIRIPHRGREPSGLQSAEPIYVATLNADERELSAEVAILATEGGRFLARFIRLLFLTCLWMARAFQGALPR